MLALGDALPSGGLVTVATLAIDAITPGAGGRRVSPTAIVALTGSGFGLRDIAAPRALEEAVAQQGGHLEIACEPGRSARLAIHLSLVCPSRADDSSRAPRASDAAAPGTGSLKA